MPCSCFFFFCLGIPRARLCDIGSSRQALFGAGVFDGPEVDYRQEQENFQQQYQQQQQQQFNKGGGVSWVGQDFEQYHDYEEEGMRDAARDELKYALARYTANPRPPVFFFFVCSSPSRFF